MTRFQGTPAFRGAIVLFWLAVAAVALAPDPKEFWFQQVGYGLALVSATAAVLVYWRSRSWLLAAAFLVVSLSGVYFSEARPHPYIHLGADAVAVLRAGAARGLTFFWALALVALAAPEIGLRACQWAAFGSSLLILCRAAAGLDPWGINGVHSIDSAFIASVWPLMLSSGPFSLDARELRALPKARRLAYDLFAIAWCAAVPIAAIVVARGSTGIGGAALAVGVLALWHARGNRRRIVGGLGCVLAIVLLGALTQGWDKLLENNGRFARWEFLLDWFSRRATWREWAFGFGLGSFLPVAGGAQSAAKLRELFPWAHCSPLQVFFELGISGLAVAVAVAVGALRRVRRAPAMLASLCVYLATSLIQMHQSYFFTAAFGACLISAAFRRQERPGAREGARACA